MLLKKQWGKFTDQHLRNWQYLENGPGRENDGGGGAEKESASNPPYPVQNDKDTHLSGTLASAAYAAKISLAVTVAKETVLENRGKKHSPEDQASTAAAALLTTSAPVRNSSE